ncbi:hypothetical protein BBBOND_0204440 [Babesia bigemina]|uniref:Uncharacterized protein n=1 Tax=Babesia bigemina TaxID=5866 RepID=A0A061D3J3_BABBI|nr:hypothetical protein BBBOND_0204440 [Babesia bigemina]CDR95286.1 hypothetical protein BBBOND_0204440 [Babesia bigemina]|eukprot:XP_012767472.1 hypothetical protein BBBOND_0204440 [Babesia bigemina]
MARYIEANGHRCESDEDPPRSAESPAESRDFSDISASRNQTSVICTKINILKTKTQMAFSSLKERFQKKKTH